MTPRELMLCGEAFQKRQEAEVTRTRQGAYLTAMLVRAKHMPKYESMFPQEGAAGQEMTDEGMFVAVKALNAAFGGEDTTGKEVK